MRFATFSSALAYTGPDRHGQTNSCSWKQTLRNLILGKVINPDLYGGFDQLVALLFRLRRELIPKWLEECLEEISAHDVSFIGFTCMFDQTISSVALAKLIKEKDPDKLIALGGLLPSEAQRRR